MTIFIDTFKHLYLNFILNVIYDIFGFNSFILFYSFLFAFLYGPFLFRYHPLNISEILKIQLPL